MTTKEIFFLLGSKSFGMKTMKRKNWALMFWKNNRNGCGFVGKWFWDNFLGINGVCRHGIEFLMKIFKTPWSKIKFKMEYIKFLFFFEV